MQDEPSKVMVSLGLNPRTWQAEALAWGMAAMGRPELNKRFQELMQAPWE